MGSAGLPLVLLLLAGALVRIPGSEGGKETPAHFLYQEKSECRFLNGTQRVRYLQRYFYDRQEFARFDSARGEYEAVTALGKATAEASNRDKQELQYQKAKVDSFCRHNYEVSQSNSVVGRRAKPTVSISPTKLDPASPNTILLCIARGFYPVEIEVRWLKNGRPEEEEGVAFGEELQNGDWTYQLHVMLETQPQRGGRLHLPGGACQPGGPYHRPVGAPILQFCQEQTLDGDRGSRDRGDLLCHGALPPPEEQESNSHPASCSTHELILPSFLLPGGKGRGFFPLADECLSLFCNP